MLVSVSCIQARLSVITGYVFVAFGCGCFCFATILLHEHQNSINKRKRVHSFGLSASVCVTCCIPTFCSGCFSGIAYPLGTDGRFQVYKPEWGNVV